MVNHPNSSHSKVVTYDVAVVGAGAAGWYAVAHLLRQNPGLKIIVLEASQKSLAKLRISGGGRCNVTHKPMVHKDFAQNYARGEKAMHAALHHHSAENVIDFFAQDGIRIVAEADGRMFPHTNTSETIARSLERPWREGRVEVQFGQRVKALESTVKGWILKTVDAEYFAKAVLLCAGGQTQAKQSDLLFGLPIPIIAAVPSLFSFRSESLRNGELPGVSLVNAKLSLGKLQTAGPLMFTHEGISGPAALRLSAFGARSLAESDYQASLTLSLQGHNVAQWTTEIQKSIQGHSRKNVTTRVMDAVPARLWDFITQAAVSAPKNYGDLSKKEINDIASHLGNWTITTNGKSTNKDEFVTAGGIDLKAIDFRTMQLKAFRGLFAAGEILDIDGVTGGFNFQAAWTTGFLGANGIVKYLYES